MKYQPYPAYKESGVEWMGIIPEEWRLQKVSIGYQIQLGKMLQPEAKSSDDNLVFYLRAQNVQWSGIDVNEIKGMWASPSEMKHFSVDQGDLLICEGGEAGRSCLIDCDLPDPCIIQNSVHRLRSTTNSLEFLDYYMHFISESNWLDVLCNKSTIVHFTSEKLSNLKLSLPPPPTQRVIATFLDNETARIDSLIKDYEELIVLLQEKRQALIFNAVTRGLSELVHPKDFEFGEWTKPVKFKDSGVEWIGEVPQGWKIKKISHLYSERRENGSPDLPILSVSIHDGVSDRELDEKELDRKVTRSEDREKYRKVYINDLTYNMMRAWQGAFGAVAVKGMVSPAYVVAKPNCDIDSRFIEYLLRTRNAIEQMRVLSRGVTDFRLRLYWEEFKTLYIPSPSIIEQKAIMKYLDRETAKIDTLVIEAQSAIELLKEHRSALITNAVTGKINLEESTSN
jgi:type I restriction enzyme S subunit